MTLTKGGESILPYIRTIVNANHHLNQNVSELNGLDTGEINIGEFASISISWMPNIIDEFHQDYPNIMLHLIEGSTQELEKLLEENRLDFAFCSFSAPHALRLVPAEAGSHSGHSSSESSLRQL